MFPDPKPPAIYGEVEAGRSSKVRQFLENIKQSKNTLDFDAAELLLEATEKNYFQEWGYESRAAYVEANLDMKDRQVAYLTRIVSISRKMNYTRDQIENIGISKLREIFSLEPDHEWLNPETQIKEPISDHIHRLISQAPSLSYEAVKAEVRKLKGLVGDNDLTWVNYQVTRLVKDNVILPGMAAFRAYMGSKQVPGPDGGTEYSDAFVLEHIMGEILSGAPVEDNVIEDETVTEEAA